MIDYIVKNEAVVNHALTELDEEMLCLQPFEVEGLKELANFLEIFARLLHQYRGENILL